MTINKINWGLISTLIILLLFSSVLENKLLKNKGVIFLYSPKVNIYYIENNQNPTEILYLLSFIEYLFNEKYNIDISFTNNINFIKTDSFKIYKSFKYKNICLVKENMTDQNKELGIFFCLNSNNRTCKNIIFLRNQIYLSSLIHELGHWLGLEDIISRYKENYMESGSLPERNQFNNVQINLMNNKIFNVNFHNIDPLHGITSNFYIGLTKDYNQISDINDNNSKCICSKGTSQSNYINHDRFDMINQSNILDLKYFIYRLDSTIIDEADSSFSFINHIDYKLISKYLSYKSDQMVKSNEQIETIIYEYSNYIRKRNLNILKPKEMKKILYNMSKNYSISQRKYFYQLINSLK